MAFTTIDYGGSTDDSTDDSSNEWDYTEPSSDPSDDGYTFEDPDDELRDAAFGEDTSDQTDDLGGSAILAAGGATTAAGRTISGTDTEIDPSASRNITDAAESAVEGDDPDMDPQEAFERANAALQEQAPMDTIDVGGMEFHPLLLLGLIAGGGLGVHYLGGGS